MALKVPVQGSDEALGTRKETGHGQEENEAEATGLRRWQITLTSPSSLLTKKQVGA